MSTYQRCRYPGCEEAGVVKLQMLFFCPEHAVDVTNKRTELRGQHNWQAAKYATSEIEQQRHAAWVKKNKEQNAESRNSIQFHKKQQQTAAVMKVITADILSWPKREHHGSVEEQEEGTPSI